MRNVLGCIILSTLGLAPRPAADLPVGDMYLRYYMQVASELTGLPYADPPALVLLPNARLQVAYRAGPIVPVTGPVNGFYRYGPRTMYVSLNLDANDMAAVLLHESVHHLQAVNDAQPASRCAYERQAEAAETQFRVRYLGQTVTGGFDAKAYNCEGF